MAAATSLPHTGLTLCMLNLVPPATDGVPAQASNLDHGLYATSASLEGEQARKPATVLLVQGHQHAIDRPVLVGHIAVRMLPTLLAGTDMNAPSTLS
jgi:hypothetical protein